MPRKVLLVEPDTRRRGAIRDALSACGMSVIESSTSTEAMGHLRGETVECLIVTDESRQLALKGLCGLVRRGRPDARIFVILHRESDRSRVSSSAGDGGLLLSFDVGAEQIAADVLASFGEKTPAVWRFEKTKTIKKSKLWEVHLAKHKKHGDVMLTQLSDQFAQDEELRAEFIQAASEVAALTHPNLPNVLDVGGGEDIPFIVTEYVRGETLHELRRRIPNGSWFSPKASAWIASELARALECAHGASFVHGAISPENIWITADGRVLLLHLGIAGFCNMLERSMRSSVGLAIPQPYLAPEQIQQNQADVRTDAFLVGVILWELLARAHLFLRDNASQTRQAILDGEIPDMDRRVPSAISEVAVACLERNAAFRPQTAGSLRGKLETALASLEAPPPPPPAISDEGPGAIDADDGAPAKSGFLGRLFSRAGSGTGSAPNAPAGFEDAPTAPSGRIRPAPSAPREEIAALIARGSR